MQRCKLLFLILTFLAPNTLATQDFLKNLFTDVVPSFNAFSSKPLQKRADGSALDTNPDGSTFLWLLQDKYSGSTFFDGFDFYDQEDPTHGTVNYVNRSFAFENGLAYVQDDGVVIMKGDNTSWLADGEYRNSVRISSTALYNTGLFIIDINRAPWGCGVWPAWWTLGNGEWPYTGEIDIIEGVHDNSHNQVAWHTGGGCYLTPESNFTGTVVQLNGEDNLNCKSDNNFNDNSGCAVTEWSRSSYGEDFDKQGGGVFAMKWDENSIAVWSFYRAAVPQDIIDGSPNPSTWGEPSAALESTGCNITNYFMNHSVIFDITFCGDWAGNSYDTTDCPGTCAERIKDPSNFVNASWSINSMTVYRKQLIHAEISATLPGRLDVQSIAQWMNVMPLILLGLFVVHWQF